MLLVRRREEGVLVSPVFSGAAPGCSMPMLHNASKILCCTLCSVLSFRIPLLAATVATFSGGGMESLRRVRERVNHLRGNLITDLNGQTPSGAPLIAQYCSGLIAGYFRCPATRLWCHPLLESDLPRGELVP